MFIPDRDAEGNIIQKATPFAAKTLSINGATKKIFKRVHGIHNPSVSAGQTVNIELIIPYAWVKFTGAEIFGCELGDIVNFTVHDTVNNDISGLDPQIYGANVQLNKFGYDVIMPNDKYANTSEYDADLYQNMIIRCTYTNNGASAKYIGINVWLHEIKD